MENTLITLTSSEGAILETKNLYCDKNIEIVPALQSKIATTGEIVKADNGYVGLSEVDTNPAFEAGKQTGHDAFWDAFQIYGNRRDYQYAFAGLGIRDSFYPKYDIIVTRGEYMFASTDSFDVAERLEQLGITLDTSACTSFNNFTRYGAPSRFPTIDTRSTGNLGNFAVNSSVRTYDKIILREDGSQSIANMFFMCGGLKNLTIEGTIGQNGFNVSWSLLSKASLTSVVNALSSTTTGFTTTLRLSAVNTAFETSEGAADGSTSEEWLALADSKPNWTINLIDS